MPDQAILKMISEYGIAIIGLVFLSRFLMQLIRYILERNKTREDMVMNMMTTDLKHLTESLNALTLNMTNFTLTVAEAHKYQRDEHKDQSDDHKQQSEQHLLMMPILKDITTTLGRINGFTHTGPKGDKGEQGIAGKDR